LEDYQKEIGVINSKFSKALSSHQFDLKASKSYEALVSELQREVEEYSSKNNMSSYNSTYSVRDIFEEKAMLHFQDNNRPSLIKMRKAHDFVIDTTYRAPELIGKKSKKQKDGISDQILDLDFGAVEQEATDFEKDMLKVLNSHLKKYKTNSKLPAINTETIADRGDDVPSASNEKFKDEMKLITPEKHREDEGSEREDAKQDKQKPPEAKAFYDDWGDVDFKAAPAQNTLHKNESELTAGGSKIVEETFEKFGLKMVNENPWEEQKPDANWLEGSEKNKKKTSPASEFLLKLPDYAFLVDSNI
jgi:hypothetical protein